jgi:hypothetical protein
MVRFYFYTKVVQNSALYTWLPAKNNYIDSMQELERLTNNFIFTFIRINLKRNFVSFYRLIHGIYDNFKLKLFISDSREFYMHSTLLNN